MKFTTSTLLVASASATASYTPSTNTGWPLYTDYASISFSSAEMDGDKIVSSEFGIDTKGLYKCVRYDLMAVYTQNLVVTTTNGDYSTIDTPSSGKRAFW